MTATTATRRPRGPRTALRTSLFGLLAAAWYLLTTFTPTGLPGFAAVAVLGGLVMLGLPPDDGRHGVVATRRTVLVALLGTAAFVPVLSGMDLLLGRVPVEAGHALLATCAAACVVLARFAGFRDTGARALLGRRELVGAVTVLVAGARSFQAGDVFVAMLVLAVLTPVVMAVRRIRRRDAEPRRLTHAPWARQAGNVLLLLVMAGVAELAGTSFLWRVVAPGAQEVLSAMFWTGLVATAVLAAFPRRRISAATNTLVALGSLVLAAQLVLIAAPPTNPVRIGVPLAGEWTVLSGGRATLVNAHRSLQVQRDAVDIARFVDGRTHRGDGSRLEDYAVFGAPVLAVADGRVTEVVDGHPDAPVGGRTWRAMAGNHVVLDIGGGHHVLYGHLQQGSIAVGPGDVVRRGDVIGRVGDSGNSDEPHLHLQVQNTPTFDVADRTIRTFPMLFDGVPVPDPRRGDTVGPAGP
ncbi:MAG: M23 family metallopeptidase [Pseudonocardia sp.]